MSRVRRDRAAPGRARTTTTPAPPKPRLLLHAGLFLATFLTTTATGALEAHRMQAINPIRDGLPYSVPLMFILLCHEFGHYIAARLHGVPASLPYFIPLPPGLGWGRWAR